MSDLMQIIKSRRSTRAFESKLPPKEQIMQLVEAAEWAPSGMGKYLWHFTVVYSAENRCALRAQSPRRITAVRTIISMVHRSISLFPTRRMNTMLLSMAQLQWKTCF